MYRKSSTTARADARGVGQNLQHYRTARGLSRAELGNAIGVTVQEIEKYERGVDPIGSRRLLQISRILEVPFASFIDGNGEEVSNSYPEVSAGDEGFDTRASSGPHLTITEMLATRHASEMLQAFCKIKSVDLRRKLLRVVERVAAAARR